MKIFTHRWLRIVLLAAPVAAVLAALLIIQPWSTSPNYQTVFAKAASAAANINSFRMTYSGGTVSDTVNSSGILEAEIAGPDSYYLKTTSDGGSQEYIVTGDKQYIKNDNIHAGGSIGFKNPTSLLQQFEGSDLDKLVDPQKLPDEEIRGVDCLHYSGLVDIDKAIAAQKQITLDYYTKAGKEPPTDAQLETMLAATKQMTMDLEVWIGKDDYIIRQFTQNVQMPDMSSDGTVRIGTISVHVTQTYYDFNVPITIVAPVDSNGQLLPGWRLEDSIPAL